MVNGMEKVLPVRRREIRDTDLDDVACSSRPGIPTPRRELLADGTEPDGGPAGAAGRLPALRLPARDRVRSRRCRPAALQRSRPRAARFGSGAMHRAGTPSRVYRMHAPLLIAAALKRRDVTYMNVSPAPHTWSTVEAQGFQAYASGQDDRFSDPFDGARDSGRARHRAGRRRGLRSGGRGAADRSCRPGLHEPRGPGRGTERIPSCSCRSASVRDDSPCLSCS